MQPPPLPEHIGPYRILRAIARGGMAEVYEVEEPASGEHLALKLLVHQGSAQRRFNREYEAMIRLNHPNIVRVYHYGLHHGSPWLTMELVQGTPVQAYVKHVGRPGAPERNRELIRVGHDLAQALRHIHRRGLVHRDLKSANVLVLPDGRVKLLDFGSARVSDADPITREGEFVGTFAYAAPEQLMGRPVDHRSDLYSLGVLLYRMATGKRPFESTDLRELARLHCNVDPKPPRTLVPSISPTLEKVILWLLKKPPEDRPQSGEEVAWALEQIAGGPLVLPGTLEMHLSDERLIGREDELALLRGFLDEQTPGGIALVIGLEGSGRGRLLRAVEREARARGCIAYTCTLDPRRDLARFTAMFENVARSLGDPPPPAAAQAMRLLATVSADSNTLPAIRQREYLRSAGTTLLTLKAEIEPNPIVVSMHDLHHASPATFDLLVGLREGLDAVDAPVLFVASYDAAFDTPRALPRKRLPDALRVMLPPLDPRQVALLVGSLLHRRPPPAILARRIHSASGGMPIFVEDVVQGMVEAGILREQGRDPNRLEWARRGTMEIPVPPRARASLHDELAGLNQPQRRVLEALAVLGGEADLTMIASGLDREAAELEQEVTSLRDGGWVNRENRGDRRVLSWRRQLAQDVMLGSLNPCRKRVFEDRLSVALRRAPASTALIRTLAATGQVPEAVTRAIAFAEQLLEELRPVSALEILDPIMSETEGIGQAGRREQARLYLLHANCLLMARPLDPHTRRSLDRAAELADQSPGFQAEIALTKAQQQRAIGHYPNYRKFLMEAWRALGDPPPPRIGCDVALKLGESLSLGSSRKADHWYEKAYALATQSGSPQQQAHAQSGRAARFLAMGNIVAAEDTAARALEIFDRAGDRQGVSEILPVWAECLRQQGRFSQALDVLGVVTPEYRQAETPSLYVRLLVAQAWLELEVCRLGRAQECVDELAATLRPGEHLHLRLQSHLVWGRILLESDQTYEAAEVLAEVRTKAHSAGLTTISEIARAFLGWTLWNSGQRHQAQRHFEQAFQVLARTGHVPSLLAACVGSARVMCEYVRPDQLFAPVASFLKTQPLDVVRLEWLIAQGRYLRRRKKDARPVFQDAHQLLERIARNLDDTDQAALRVHPWSRWIRAGLGEQAPEDMVQHPQQ